MLIYCVRHAPTIYNEVELECGGDCNPDPDITETGINLAKEAADKFQQILLELDEPPEVVYSSSNLRALTTAEIITCGTGLEIIVLKDLRERDSGSLNGVSYADYEDMLISEAAINGLESVDEFQRRLEIAYAEIIHNQKSCLIVTHGGVLRYWEAYTGTRVRGDDENDFEGGSPFDHCVFYAFQKSAGENQFQYIGRK
jgi:broad specificity phosphatase PhoE